MSPTQLTTATVKIRLAAAVVIYEDHILVVQRSWTERFKPGVWGVPCGKADPIDRDLEATAIRELREETGLEGVPIEEAGNTKFESIWQGQPADNIQYNYLMELTGRFRSHEMPKVITPKDQASKWVPVRRIDDAGLDDHNLRSVYQVLTVLSRRSDTAGWHDFGLSSAKTSSSWRR
jgi:8-oxo-dGTP diphosphatase